MAAAPVSRPPSEAPSERKQAVFKGASGAEATANSLDNVDNPRFKELQRSLRNALKKLNATAKVDSIIAENPGKKLDELVEENKINSDQKAQALKKPALQASIAQIEEQIVQYKQFAASYEERLVSQKAELEKAHKEELDAVREKAVAEAEKASKDDLRKKLLSLSKFLCAAATMRRSGDETSSESHAFEGVLYQVYGGSEDAVNSMIKLVEGADEKIVSVEGNELEVTYGKVKAASEGPGPAATDAGATENAASSDPTLVNAASTELQDTAFGSNAAPASDPNVSASIQTEHIAPPAQTIVSNAANPVAESAWDPNSITSPASANTEGWVEVPRNPAETDAGLEKIPATVAQPSGQEAENAAVPKKQQNGDGFEPVGGHQRQSSGRGRGRGRGRGDGFRGRGRGGGEFRGRGRGRGGGSGGRGRGGSSGAPAPATAQ